MDRLEKVATPLTAATVDVPDSVPPPGLLPMATVTLAVEVVTVLLNASCTATCTAGAIDAPAVAVVGCTMNATPAAAAGTTVCCCGVGVTRLEVGLTNGVAALVPRKWRSARPGGLGMVKPPPPAARVHAVSVYQVTVPVELEAAVKPCP